MKNLNRIFEEVLKEAQLSDFPEDIQANIHSTWNDLNGDEIPENDDRLIQAYCDWNGSDSLKDYGYSPPWIQKNKSIIGTE